MGLRRAHATPHSPPLQLSPLQRRGLLWPALPAPAFSASRFTAGAIISASSSHRKPAGRRGGRSLSDRWHDGHGMPVPQPHACPPSRAPTPCHGLITVAVARLVCSALAAVRGAQLMIMRHDQRLSISISLSSDAGRSSRRRCTHRRGRAFLVDCDPVATHPPKFGLCDRVQLLLTFGDGGAK
jgi:hypothetical protein